MNNSLLTRLIKNGESESVEFVSPLVKMERIGEIVCSFLNKNGGTIILGVSDNGKIIGIKNVQKYLDQVRKHLFEKISPRFSYSMVKSQINNKETILIDLPKGNSQPYSYSDQIFIRSHLHTRVATASDISQLIDQRHRFNSRWESLPALGLDLKDLDKEEILRAAKEARDERLYVFPNPGNPSSILEELNLSLNRMLLNSALVLFANDPTRRFPQIRIRAARFKGIEKSSFIDNQVFEGHAFNLLRKSEKFLRSYIPIESELPKKGLKRQQKPSYPWLAIREALINAIIHRDYEAFDGGLSIEIYDDRIEFWNSGMLPSGMTIQDLKQKHPSRPHNPDIAQIFFLRGFIERYGIGTQSIINQCLEAGLPEPEWREISGGISLIIRLQKVSTTKSISIEMNKRQISLLKKYKPGNEFTPSDYFRLVSNQVKERRARTDLVDLTRDGFLLRKGRGSSITYVRTKKSLPRGTSRH